MYGVELASTCNWIHLWVQMGVSPPWLICIRCYCSAGTRRTTGSAAACVQAVHRLQELRKAQESLLQTKFLIKACTTWSTVVGCKCLGMRTGRSSSSARCTICPMRHMPLDTLRFTCSIHHASHQLPYHSRSVSWCQNHFRAHYTNQPGL